MVETRQVLSDSVVTQLATYTHGTKKFLHLFEETRKDLKPIYLGSKIEDNIMDMEHPIMQHYFSGFKARPINKELGYPMHVSLILEPKGSNASLLSMDVKEIYEEQWDSNSLSMKFARLQHRCQQEQKL